MTQLFCISPNQTRTLIVSVLFGRPPRPGGYRILAFPTCKMVPPSWTSSGTRSTAVFLPSVSVQFAARFLSRGLSEHARVHPDARDHACLCTESQAQAHTRMRVHKWPHGLFSERFKSPTRRLCHRLSSVLVSLMTLPYSKQIVIMSHPGCDDAQVKIWRIPEGGLTEPLTEPDAKLKGSSFTERCARDGRKRHCFTFWACSILRANPANS